MTQAELAAATAAPLWKWEYKYTLPTDFLRIVQIVGQGGKEIQDWEIQGASSSPYYSRNTHNLKSSNIDCF
ncbi:hypothetical protein OAN24_00335 [Pseudodesulfovibrio sp.]|nr:hypothetical protein [Pseudodesulfovibrio sp.]